MGNFLTMSPLYVSVEKSTAGQVGVKTVADVVGAEQAAVDSLGLFDADIRNILDVAADKPKFWLVEDLWHWLKQIGVGTTFANILSFVVTAVVLGLLIWLLDTIVRRLIMRYFKKVTANSKNKLDDFLFSRSFFQRAFDLLPLIVLLMAVDTVFDGFNKTLILCVKLGVQALIVLIVLRIIYSLLNAYNDMYDARPQTHRRSIKGYIQVAKIVLGVIAVLIVTAILTQRNLIGLFTGLGAAAALLSLVFKDTISGFVASVQLSSQDMLRPGDWIEMPSQNANGTVLDINVNSVKVRNWDNSITMIPILSMVTQSFVNWRGMEQSAGRKFVQTIGIDLKSLFIVDDRLTAELQADAVIAPLLDKALELAGQSSPGRLSNLALYRAFMELYLRNNSKINQSLAIYVKYLNSNSVNGVAMEFSAYSSERSSVGNDKTVRALMEFIVVTAPVFGVLIFQNPTSAAFIRIDDPVAGGGKTGATLRPVPDDTGKPGDGASGKASGDND